MNNNTFILLHFIEKPYQLYTRQETSKQRQAFWTTFGQYMHPILSADGIEINWVNYKTGVKGINFKMDAGDKKASIAIVLSQNELTAQQICYNQLLLLQTLFHDTLTEKWQWQKLVTDEQGKTISKVSKTISGININRTEDWPTLITFFKPRMIALDTFWSMTRYGFEI